MPSAGDWCLPTCRGPCCDLVRIDRVPAIDPCATDDLYHLRCFQEFEIAIVSKRRVAMRCVALSRRPAKYRFRLPQERFFKTRRWQTPVSCSAPASQLSADQLLFWRPGNHSKIPRNRLTRSGTPSVEFGEFRGTNVEEETS